MGIKDRTQMELYKGDCLEVIDKLIEEGVKVNFTLTSPPYNRKRNDKYANYKDVREDWFDWMCEVIDKLLLITEDYVFFNVQKTYYNKQDVFKLIGKYNKEIKEIIIWEKSNPMPASGFSITNAYEYILVLGVKSLKSNCTYTKNHITTSVHSKMPKNHKAVMKPEVAEWVVSKFTKENDVGFDCFMGLGTTGVACKNLNRDFIGIELNEEYFNIAKDRIK